MRTRIKRTILKLGRVKRKVFCLFGRHKWRSYHRRIKVRWDPDTVVINASRRVCVHCGKRETVDVTPLAAAIAYESAIAELDRQRWSESEANEPRTPAHPRGLGIDRDPFEAVSNESGAPSLPAEAHGEGKAGYEQG